VLLFRFWHCNLVRLHTDKGLFELRTPYEMTKKRGIMLNLQ
jgi:hypothetical protein